MELQWVVGREFQFLELSDLQRIRLYEQQTY